MTRKNPENRDELLGVALRSLPVPPHRDDFFERLEDQLAQERPPRRSVRRRFFERRLVLRVAVAGALLMALAIAVVLPHSGGGPERASAASLAEQVELALADAHTITGEMDDTGGDYAGTGELVPRHYIFALTDRGDFALTGLGLDYQLVYDARTGVERQYAPFLEDSERALERRGLAPAAPDQYATGEWASSGQDIFLRRLRTIVRALRADSDQPAEEIQYRDRTAWHVVVSVEPNKLAEPGTSPNSLDVTIDQRTGLPLRVIEQFDERVLSQLWLEHVIDAPVRESRFQLEFPAETDISSEDVGFKRVSLERAQQTVGYRPLVPAWRPKGFQLSEVAVARRPGGETGTHTGKEGMNPEDQRVVSMAYRRGLDVIFISTRLRHPVAEENDGSEAGTDSWTDPLDAPEGEFTTPEPLQIESGALAGAEAQLVLSNTTIPHIWALTSDLVVTISGDLDRDELISVASSLELLE